MKEFPIIFSGPMVRANHMGIKRMTRRFMDPQPFESQGYWYWLKRGKHYQLSPVFTEQQDGSGLFPFGPSKALTRCPYGQAGDRIWVRETWNVARCGLDWETGSEFSAFEWDYNLYGNPQQYLSTEAPRGSTAAMLFYAADGNHPSEFEPFTGLNGKKVKAEIPWRPSIHMPRWACRDVYDVIKIRVERLQDISEADAYAEGFEIEYSRFDFPPRMAFSMLWDSINGKKPGRAWADNPWVWVVEYDNPLWGKA